jgi:hypothetical protein
MSPLSDSAVRESLTTTDDTSLELFADEDDEDEDEDEDDDAASSSSVNAGFIVSRCTRRVFSCDERDLSP